MTPLTAQNEKMTDHIDIVLLNCKTKEDIVSYLQKCTEKWEKMPETDKTKYDIKAFSDYLRMIHQRVYEHDVPEKILTEIRRLSEMDITPQTMYYLSSVTVS